MFPQSPLTVAVDLYIFANWVEVTRLSPTQAGVYARDNIGITRGRSAEGADVDPTTIRLTLNNRDGRYSPRNPISPLYGEIGRNTPLRVRLGNDIRAVGEVSSWPSRWDTSGADVWVPVQASGILRRLSQGTSPLRSPIYRHIVSGTVTDLTGDIQAGQPVAYWPCEDVSGATQIASAVGGQPMGVAGAPTFADNEDFPGSDPLPTVALSRWTGTVPTYTSTDGTHTISFLLSVPAAGITDGVILLRARCSGTAARFDAKYILAAGGGIQILAYDSAGTLLFSSGSFALGVINGTPLRVDLRLVQSGSNITVNFNYSAVAGGPAAGSSDGPVSSRTVGRVVNIQAGPNRDVNQAAVGHLAIWGTEAVLAQSFSGAAISLSSMDGYPGETAGTRISRLCGEEGITYRRVPPSHTSTSMGIQRSGALLDILREAAGTDQGILFEPRDFLGLAFIDRQGLYNRDPALTLDYPSHQLTDLEPVDDDQLVRNDITVSRVDGSSERQALDTGPISIQAPPDGVGRYDDQVTINPELDADLRNQAGWRLHLGTVDEARYPTITLNLANPAFTGDDGLTAAARALDIGGRLIITNPPAWLPPDQISQAVQGMTETLNAYQQTIGLNCTPESPWQVGVYDQESAASPGADPGFEVGTNGATPSGFFGGPAPSLAQSTLHPTEGTHSLEVSWDVGGQGLVALTLSGLTVGREYTAWLDAYIPSGAPDVQLGVAGVTFGTQRSEKDTPIVLTVTWAATSVADQLQVIGQPPAGAGTKCYLDALTIWSPDDVASKYSSDGSSLAAAAAATDTALSVATPSGPLWTTDITQMPLDLRIGGERVLARYVAGGTSPQAFTVVRAVNGISKAQPAGADVVFFRPAIYAL